MICVFIIILLLVVIGALLIKRNKKNKFSKMFENFQINDEYNNDGPESTSSDLVGPGGILQTLPHCFDLWWKPKSKKKFPLCCDDDSYEKGKCKRAFPRHIYTRKDIDENIISTKYRVTSAAKDNLYQYNPLFPYSRINVKEPISMVTKLLNTTSMGMAALLNMGSVKMAVGDVSNWGRLESATLGTFPPSADVDFRGKPVTNWSNNRDLMEYYMKIIALGKDKDGASLPCSIDNPENCESIGDNRWERIGVCPDDPDKDLYAYVDVKNTYNTLGKVIPKGLAPGVAEDMLRLANPFKLATDIEKVLLTNSKCMKTKWENKAGRKTHTDGDHHYIPYLTEGDINN